MTIPRWSVELAVIALNAISVAATVVLTYWLARVCAKSEPVALLSATVVAVLPATARTYSMMWTEPPFTVLVLISLLLLVTAVRDRCFRPWHVALLGVVVSVATLLRIAGVALIPLVVVGAWLATSTRPLARRATYAIGVGLVSSAGLGAIALRNASLGVPALGARTSGTLPFPNLVGHSLRAVGRFVVPETGGLMPIGALAVQGSAALIIQGVTILVGALLFLILGLAVVRALRRRDLPLVVLGLWVVLWWALLWYSVLAAGVDPPEDRLLTPALPAMVLLVVDWIASTRRRQPGRVATPQLLAALAALAWGLFVTTAGVMAVVPASQVGIGYNRVALRESALVASLQSLPADSVIVATDPWLVYWTSRRTTYSVYDDRVVPLAKEGGVQFVVLLPGSKRTAQSFTDEGVELVLVQAFTEGSLYHVAKA